MLLLTSRDEDRQSLSRLGLVPSADRAFRPDGSTRDPGAMSLPFAAPPGAARPRRFVIAAGMQRSGTRWFCNMLVDIVGEVTGSNTRQLRDSYGVQGLLQRYHTPTFQARLSHRRLRRLEAILADGHTLVFKTHRPPTAALRERIAHGSAVATYLLRDPRDVVVSALDQGAKMRAQGALPFRGFARLTSFDRAARWLERRLLPVWQQWASIDGVLTLRYEDLLADPRGMMARNSRSSQHPRSTGRRRSCRPRLHGRERPGRYGVARASS